MRLIGKHKIQPLLRGCLETKIWVLALADEIKNTVWISEDDLKAFYPSAFRDAEGVFIFRVEPNSCAVKVKFCFINKIAFISQVIVSGQ
jgi:mRNA-degrading endonuclease HigB of HigAB toxin-antitoxin module